MDLQTKRLIVLGVFFLVPVLSTLFLIAFDIWVCYRWGEEAMISHAMREVHPMIIFTVAFVMGGLIFGLACHFWWGLK